MAPFPASPETLTGLSRNASNHARRSWTQRLTNKTGYSMSLTACTKMVVGVELMRLFERAGMKSKHHSISHAAQHFGHENDQLQS
jgi:hypothetical protein